MATNSIMEPQQLKKLKPQETHWVSKTNSEEYNLLRWALNHSSVIGLDAEWKPCRTKQSCCFPTVCLLQIACRVNDIKLVECTDSQNGLRVFLVDLVDIDNIASIWELLRDMFISPHILKLGFMFKQDLVNLSSTFSSHEGCELGFDKVEPYLDIATIYNHLQQKQPACRNNMSKDTKGLAAICKEVLGVSLSKELQCSDWSHRPLTEDQKTYAAADAQCLLEIFSVFEEKILKQGYSLRNAASELQPANNALCGLKCILVKQPHAYDNVLQLQFWQALDIVRRLTIVSEVVHAPHVSRASSCVNGVPFGVSLSNIVRQYGERILLKESDRKPRTSREKGKSRPDAVSLGDKQKQVENYIDWQEPPPILLKESDRKLGTYKKKWKRPATVSIGDIQKQVENDIDWQGPPPILLKESDRKLRTSRKNGRRPATVSLGDKLKQVENYIEWQGPLPWDFSLGGDGCPKFLCDVMVKGLASHLRAVGIDAAYSKKSVPRQLIDQAHKEKRVILTRNVKLLEPEYLITNQIYWMKSQLKDDQLIEVIKTFKLKISEDQLMSRCTKCNGVFIQKRLSTEEAGEVAKGFQVIPDCTFNRMSEFWQCTDCKQLYWEGLQHRKAVKKFIDLCR